MEFRKPGRPMTESEAALEPMQQEDIEEAAKLVAVAMNEHEGHWAKRTMAHHFECQRQHLTDGRDYFLWRPEKTIIGLAGLHHYIWGPPENVWLAWFAVHPDMQQRGLGRRLLKAAEKMAVDRGYRKLLVETYGHPDFDGARAFYSKNGFGKIGFISNYLPDGSSMEIFGKILTP
jgi:GNAT superfamily N-acetyltransferase